MKMKPVPTSKTASVSSDRPVYTATVPFAALEFDRETRTIAEEYLYSPVVAEFVAQDITPAVWCDPVGPNKYRVIIQDENLLNFAAAFQKDRQNIPIIMLS